MGESGLSVAQAGQRSWQRLQAVQASASKDVFPGEVCHGGCAELFRAFVLQVDGRDKTFFLKWGKECVGAGQEYVFEFCVGEGGNKAQHQYKVKPPE